jgi:hypothetical protein
MIGRWVPIAILTGLAASGQSLTPRELFYKPVAKPPVVTPGKKTPTPIPTPTDKPPTPVAYAPLGLRYSLLHSSDGAGYSEVDADTMFHSGDKLKVTAQSNDPAHLYVIARGSSGNWQVLFPSAQVGGGDNKVAAMKEYEIPPGGRFYFDENPGEEKLFVVLSRKPVENLEALIYDLGKKPKEGAPEKSLVLAQRIAPIDDAMVGRLRAGVQARDLVFEKVDEKTAGPKKEKAVYVVNTKTAPDARLVVDLTLRHR